MPKLDSMLLFILKAGFSFVQSSDSIGGCIHIILGSLSRNDQPAHLSASNHPNPTCASRWNKKKRVVKCSCYIHATADTFFEKWNSRIDYITIGHVFLPYNLLSRSVGDGGGCPHCCFDSRLSCCCNAAICRASCI